jgi:nucleotide-binding universal stress UspA family protein
VTVQGIVVGVDGSRASQWALTWALREAVLRDKPLTALLAWIPAGWGDEEAGRTKPDEQHRVERWLHRGRLDYERSFGESPRVPMQAVAPTGRPERCLLETAGSADLVVVGSRGMGAVKRSVLGSVSTHLVEHAPCPVTVVPGPRHVHDPGAQVRWLEGDDGRTPGIVVGVDGSEPSARALAWAMDRAVAARLPVVAVAVWHLDREVEMVAPVTSERRWKAEERTTENLAEAMLTKAVAHLPAGVQVTARSTAVQASAAARGVLDAAEGARQIVVGRRGTSHLKHLLLGSVSASLAHHAACPVTVVP